MESTSKDSKKLIKYYELAGDKHVENNNYKSAYVYYTQAAEQYIKATKV